MKDTERGFGGFRKGGCGVSKHQRFGTSKDESGLKSKFLHFLLLFPRLRTRRHTVWGLRGLWVCLIRTLGPGIEKG